MPAKKRASAREQPSQDRSRLAARQIVEPTARIYEEPGCSGATTNSIAERAGVSVGVFYQYFSSQESILAVVFVENTQEEADAVGSLMVMSPSAVDERPAAGQTGR